MPSALRAQVALIGLLAVLLIPIGTSSLRGLTHILTCRDRSATPFSIDVPESGPPTISSSVVIERGPSGEVISHEVCGGLTLDLVMGSRVENRADVTLLITNNSKYGWRGSVQLQAGRHVDPASTSARSPPVAQRTTASSSTSTSNRRYEIVGNLLIGP